MTFCDNCISICGLLAFISLFITYLNNEINITFSLNICITFVTK